MDDIFGSRELKNAGYLSANHMETTLFISSASGKFETLPLPSEVQYAPVNTITIMDYDGDGNDDLLVCGNNSHTKLRLGKMDANYGVLLKNDGRGGFEYIDQMESGFKLQGDVKHVIQLDDVLLFGINQAGIISYRRSR